MAAQEHRTPIDGLNLDPDPHISQKSLVEAGGSIQVKTTLLSVAQSTTRDMRAQKTYLPLRNRLAYVAGVMQWTVLSEFHPGLSSTACLDARGGQEQWSSGSSQFEPPRDIPRIPSCLYNTQCNCVPRIRNI